MATRGKVPKYLGMIINFTETGKVIITMYDYIDEVICKLPTEMLEQSTTPALTICFNIQVIDGHQ